jgi:hypothetical protein
VVKAAEAHGVALTGIEVHKPDLEGVFLALTGVATVLPEVAALAVFAAVLLGLATRSYARTVYSPG